MKRPENNREGGTHGLGKKSILNKLAIGFILISAGLLVLAVIIAV